MTRATRSAIRPIMALMIRYTPLMAMYRLSDFKLGIGVVIKADKDSRSVGQPQVAMHRIAIFSSYFFLVVDKIMASAI